MRLTYFLIGLALILMGILLRVTDPYPFPQIRAAYFDTLQRIAPRDAEDFPLRVVAIDEASLQSVGQWPWPRSKLAALNDKLAEYGAAVVVYDVIFAEEDRYSLSRLIEDTAYGPTLTQALGHSAAEFFDNDRQFAMSFENIATVLGTSVSSGASSPLVYTKSGFVTVGKPVESNVWAADSLTLILPQLRDSADGIGVVNVSPGDDSTVVRRVPLVWRHDNRFLPSLGLEALRVALGESTYMIQSSRDLDGVIEGIKIGDYTFPTTSDGEFWVRYRHETPETYISAAEILKDGFTEDLATKLQGHIVFVGSTAPGLFDIRTTALGDKVPGVSVHVQILEQVLSNSFLVRTDYQAGIELAVFILLGIVVTMAISIKNSVVTVISGAGAAAVILIPSYLGFTRMGVLVDITFPLIGGVVNFAILSGYQFIVADRDKRALRRSFAHYVAPSVLDEIEQSGYDVGLTGETKDITVMFADIRGFTSYSENRDPVQVVAALNDLFSRLSTPILMQNGMIDKFIGDSIMALWGAPIPAANHARRGLLAALAFREQLTSFNARQREKGHPELSLATGFSSGPACVGNIGSNERFSYSAIGGTVNLASRIEGACRPIGYDIVASETTALASGLAVLPAGHLPLKGISQPLPLYIVLGDETLRASEAFKALEPAHAGLLTALSDQREDEILQDALQACLPLARLVEPGLDGFYRNILARKADFSPPISEKAPTEEPPKDV